MARELEKIIVPPLGALMAYRGVWALCNIVQQDDKTLLRASHYCTCLVGGNQPTWGMWTVRGIFQRFFGSRDQIEHTKPFDRLVWKSMSATWTMMDMDQRYVDGEAKKKILRGLYRKGELLPSAEPAAALFEGGALIPWGKHKGMPGAFRPLYLGREEEEGVSPVR